MSEQSKSQAAHAKLLDALSEQIEQVMQSAEEQASEIVESAERESARRLEEAEQRAESIVAERAAWLDELHKDLVDRAGRAREASLDFVSAIHDAARQLRAQRVVPSASERSADTIDEVPTPMPGELEGDTDEEAGATEEASKQTGEGNTGELLESLRDRLNRGSRKPMRLTRAKPDEGGEVSSERTILAKPSANPKGASEGAMLLATQMAVSGSSREEIERRLRDEFHITDTTPILDSLLDERSA